MELAAAAVIIVGSRYGLPLSTTHCMVGAVTGIGLVEAVSGKRPEGATNNRAFNWLLLAKFFLGWVATLVIAALTAAAFTAQVCTKNSGIDLHGWQGCSPAQAQQPSSGESVHLLACIHELCPYPLPPTPTRLPVCLQGVYAPFKIDTNQRVDDTLQLNTTASESCKSPWGSAGAWPWPGACARRWLPLTSEAATAAAATAHHSTPHLVNHPADAIARGMAAFATSTNNVALGEAAAVMAQACDASSVPNPPTSFNYITGCVDTVMQTLNATTYGV